MRRLLGFFLLGAMLLLAKRAVEREPEPPHLRVEVRADVSDEDAERMIDELVLVEEARWRGSPAHDPIVRSHLLSAIVPVARAAGASDEALLRRALELGMHRADPIVRKRLAFQGEQLVLSALPEPTRAELEPYYRRALARYRVPEQISFVQITFSRARRGDFSLPDATRAAERIQREALDDEAVRALGDPTLLPRENAALSVASIDARFGAGFGASVSALELGRWSSPLASAYGHHLVKPVARTEAHTPELAEVESKVRSDYQIEARRTELERALRALRSRYRIEVVRVQP